MKRRAARRRTRGRALAGTAPVSAGRLLDLNARSREDSSARLRWFRVSALILLPLLFLAGFELLLRFGGYGFSPEFFKPVQIAGEEFLVQNDDFGLRFFPPELLRLPPPLRMRAHKPPGTYRIFILGESAAMGDPEPAFGAGRYLEVLLRERYPGRRFEVINVAMTAINSHVILPIAQDCARQNGDLWIVYMGNNEMVGPFGAATVFGTQAPAIGAVRLSLALQRTRLGQLIFALIRKLGPNRGAGKSWGGMQMFLQNRVEPSDGRRLRVYRNFTSNLQRIVKTGLDSGAAVVLSTVAVNLRDCPPFASTPPNQAAGQLLQEGRGLIARGKTIEATSTFDRLARLVPQSAEAQFLLADCLAQTGRLAKDQFQAACDTDALPFRADSRINAAITEVASFFPSPRLRFCDAAANLATNSPAGVPGQESFYEHVHLTFEGNYRLALAWAEAVTASLTGERWDPSSAWVPQKTCERQLGLTDWNRSNVLDEALRRMRLPPLRDQSNNDARVQRLSAWHKELRARLDPGAAAVARTFFLESLHRAPEDFLLQEQFADFLQATGDYSQAASAWQRVRDLIPHDYVAYYQLGRLAHLQGLDQEALSWLSQSLKIRPNFEGAWLEFAKVHAAGGSFQLAARDYQKALEFQPLDAQAWYGAGLMFAKTGLREQAIGRYREAVRLDPTFWQARFELGGQLGLAGEMHAASEQFQEAVRLNPGFALSHLNLGLALVKQGKTEQARREFEETLRLEPTNQLAPICLKQLNDSQKPQ